MGLGWGQPGHPRFDKDRAKPEARASQVTVSQWLAAEGTEGGAGELGGRGLARPPVQEEGRQRARGAGARLRAAGREGGPRGPGAIWWPRPSRAWAPGARQERAAGSGRGAAGSPAAGGAGCRGVLPAGAPTPGGPPARRGLEASPLGGAGTGVRGARGLGGRKKRDAAGAEGRGVCTARAPSWGEAGGGPIRAPAFGSAWDPSGLHASAPWRGLLLSQGGEVGAWGCK